MSMHHFPFVSIVGQPQLKLALMLASVDWRLSVLLKGDKGSGKTTAARGLAGILPESAPFVNLPIGTTDDRLLGGLDLDQALRGQAALKRGLIHQANGGVLYIDEVNLLPDTLTDTLLDVASSGHHFMERDGFSASGDSKFILLGSMNIEEGALRPQLLDRFALALDVEAPIDPADRALILQSRLRFDADPLAFCAEAEDEQNRLREAIRYARLLVLNIQPSVEFLQEISHSVTKHGVRSLRADLAAFRGAIAHAALCQRSELEQADIEAVLPFVLHHRMKLNPGQHPPDSRKAPSESPEQFSGEQPERKQRVFPPEARPTRELVMALPQAVSRGQSATAKLKTRTESLDIRSSFTKSFRNTGTASLVKEQLVFRPIPPNTGVRFIFVVDSSGSQGAQQRMRAVKGAATGLLESSVDNKDEIAVISFRGAKAEIVLEPCKETAAAARLLEFLPTGGRTPLAHALQLASSLVTPNTLIVLLTDGRANVPLQTTDPWGDALEMAGNLSCAALLIDSSVDRTTAKATESLASAMRATLIRIDDLNQETLLRVIAT